MIEITTGNMLEARVDALVNTVNTVGIMGKGIALQFKQAFPENYKAYDSACRHGDVRLGEMFVWHRGALDAPKYVINFPTKKHWRSKSRIRDIEAGLVDLRRVIAELDIESIAVPALGCGNGGLAWSDVLPRIEHHLGSLPTHVLLYPPVGAPAAREMPVATTKPSMTFGRAALIALVAPYSRAAMSQRLDLVRPGASLLEIQKLMYFLQEAGQPLKLKFAKGRYGPYAENLNKVLELLEGHYIRGYGDRSNAVLALDPIEVLPGAAEEAALWLDGHPDVRRDVGRVLDLVGGWESAYGLELLGTVHFAAKSDPDVAGDVTRAVQYVHEWNARKQATFPEHHVAQALSRLGECGWFAAPNPVRAHG